MENEELKKLLNDMNTKIDTLFKIVEKDSNVIQKEAIAIEKEGIKIEKTLEKSLNIVSEKFDEIIKLFKDKKEIVEVKVKENPIAYITGTLVGGMLLGYLIGKGKEDKNKK